MSFTAKILNVYLIFQIMYNVSKIQKEPYEPLNDYIAYIHVKDAVWETGEVVLPGTGDGNLRYIFNELDKKGFCGFLSLEPHLFHFQGFDALERGETDDKKETDGVRAYKAAYASLKRIL